MCATCVTGVGVILKDLPLHVSGVYSCLEMPEVAYSSIY